MPPFDLNNLLNVLVQPDRLAPDTQAHKKRHKSKSGRHRDEEKDRDRDYRSDDGYRRRDEKSRELGRARSSHPPGDDPRRRDEDELRERSEKQPYGEHRIESQLSVHQPRTRHGHGTRARSSHRSRSRGGDEEDSTDDRDIPRPARHRFDKDNDNDDIRRTPPRTSRKKPYGEHRIENQLSVYQPETRHGHGSRARSSHRSRSRGRDEDEVHDDLDAWKAKDDLYRMERRDRQDPKDIFLTQPHETSAFVPNSRARSSPKAYGEHRVYNTELENEIPPLTLRHAYGDYPHNYLVPVDQSEHAPNYGTQPSSPEQPGSRGMAASRPQISDNAHPVEVDGRQICQEHLPSAIASQPSDESNLHARLPSLSISQHHPEISRSLNDIVTPGDSRSEAGNFTERPRSWSAASAASTALLLPTRPGSGSGVLGARSYQYQPLGEMEFRLIRVLPERMSKLKCEILHRSLNNAPDYIAISVRLSVEQCVWNHTLTFCTTSSMRGEMGLILKTLF
jgi:hypothetical protein